VITIQEAGSCWRRYRDHHKLKEIATEEQS
jgi:hypothetical protein